MGLFKLIKEIRQAVKESKERHEKFINMSSEELLTLELEDLFEAIDFRVDKGRKDYEDEYDFTASLPEKQRVFHVVNLLDMEVNNGGLCQFLVNCADEAVPFVSDCLAILGAEKHKKLFDDFISKISSDDLSDLDAADFEKQEEIRKKYPFDAYDTAFFETELLQNYLYEYVRNNIEEF